MSTPSGPPAKRPAKPVAPKPGPESNRLHAKGSFNATPEDVTLTRNNIQEFLNSGNARPTASDVTSWLVDAGYSEAAAGKVVADLDSYL